MSSVVIVSAWVLITSSKPQPSNLFCPPDTEKLINSPQVDKSPANSSMLQMFNNNTYLDFRTANKLVLVSSRYSSDLTEVKCHKTELHKIENMPVKKSLNFSLLRG